MFNVRLIIGFAALAFILSLLAGIIGAVPFGILLFRTLLGTMFFAGLGVAAGWVIQKFLPELLNVQGGNIQKVASRNDNEVDIVLPEENPHSAQNLEGVRGELDDDAEGNPNVQHEVAGEGMIEGEALSASDVDEPYPNIDDTPGLDSFESSIGLSSADSDSGGDTKTVIIGGVEQDPALAAEAIKTWLRKDKEG